MQKRDIKQFKRFLKESGDYKAFIRNARDTRISTSMLRILTDSKRDLILYLKRVKKKEAIMNSFIFAASKEHANYWHTVNQNYILFLDGRLIIDEVSRK